VKLVILTPWSPTGSLDYEQPTGLSGTDRDAPLTCSSDSQPGGGVRVAGRCKERGRRRGGRPPMIDTEIHERITAVFDGGASKASTSRTFKAPRSTLLDT
jgi:hypothetical protein